MSAASTRRGPGLNIDYPVTRSLPGKWTGLAGYVGIVILLVFVAIVNGVPLWWLYYCILLI
jgi:hypothetical protein